MSYVIGGVFTEGGARRMINKKMIVGIFTLLVVLGAFGLATASHIRSTSVVQTNAKTNLDDVPNTNGGDGHAGGNPDPTTGRIALSLTTLDDVNTEGGDGHAGGNPDPTM